MGSRDPRIDAYIAMSADFAKPILSYLRKTVHEACPEVEEDWKWSAPHFMYHGMLCGMAAFKEHCSFGFWKGTLVVPSRLGGNHAMGHFGRITRLADLPARRDLIRYIKKAAKLNQAGVQVARVSRPKPPLVVPAELRRALSNNRSARATFENFSPSHRREYIEWIGEAKTEETRRRRLETALAWMAEGKSRNWKYER